MMKVGNKNRTLFGVIAVLAVTVASLLLLLQRRESGESMDVPKGTPPEIGLQPAEVPIGGVRDTPESRSLTSVEALNGEFKTPPDSADPLLEDLPLTGISSRTGHVTDLTPSEEARAIELWGQEGKRLSRLKGFSGDIEIIKTDYLDEEKEKREETSLSGTISMRVNDIDMYSIDWRHANYPPSYEMIIADKNGKWKFVSDGTKKGSKLICDDDNLATRLREYLSHEIAFQIWEPSDFFLHPGNSKNPADPRTVHFYEHHQPMKHPEANKEPDSYMYAPPIGDTAPRNTYYLKRGHLSAAVYGRPGDVLYESFFEAYEEIDGFDFPTHVSSDFGSWKRTLRFSELKIDTLVNE